MGKSHETAESAAGRSWPAESVAGALGDRERAELLKLGTVLRYEPEDALLRQGEHSTDVYVLTSGYVRIVGDTAGGQTVLLALRTRGDLVGELAALDEGSRSASVLAATPVLARRVDRRTFLRFLRAYPQAGDVVQRSVTRKLRMATRHRVDTSGAPVLIRVCGVLETLAGSHGQRRADGVHLDVPLSQVDLATLVGASLPSVHRVLTELRRHDVLATGYQRLVVRDLSRLRALSRQTGARGSADDE